MNVKQTLDAIRATGATVSRKDGEWRVNAPKGTEATAYYTEDAEDALLTAQAMMEFQRGHCRCLAGMLFGLCRIHGNGV